MPILEIPIETLDLPISELGRLLASAMHDDESDEDEKLVIRGLERVQFEGVIHRALTMGQLQPRDPITCAPMSFVAPSSVVTVNDLARFLADIQCRVEIRRIKASAQPQATAPAPPVVAGSDSNAPLPLTTGDIAFCFDGIRWNENEWRKPLGNKPNWLKNCVAIPGQRGVSETQWNPVLIAAALVHNGHAQARSVRARFQTKQQLAPWLDAWKTYEADNFDTP